MAKQRFRGFVLAAVLALFGPAAVVMAAGASEDAKEQPDEATMVTVVDGLGRSVAVPSNPERIICSGPGCLRLLTYLQCQDAVVAVDDMESKRPQFDARPYAMANPRYRELPMFGEFRGHDNPELIVTLEPQPQVIFKTYPTMGMDPLELEGKTGIPVITLNYGDLYGYKEDMYASLRLVASVMGCEQRAQEVIAFFEEAIADLADRTRDVAEEDRLTCYVGGIAYKGPHGFQSTEPTYPPFMFVNANNVAYDPTKSLAGLQHADVAKEMIVSWNPEVLFVDVATIQSDPQASAVYELANDPAYRHLDAVKAGRVYGLLPYNWYTQNFGSVIADAYYVGTVLYPDRFRDIDPAAKADEIYAFLVGRGVFEAINDAFDGLAFSQLDF